MLLFRQRLYTVFNLTRVLRLFWKHYRVSLKVWLLKEQSKVELGGWSLKGEIQFLYPASFRQMKPIIKFKLFKIQSNTWWPNSTELSWWRPCIWCFLKSAPHPSVSTHLQSNPGVLAGQLVDGWRSPPSQQAPRFSNLFQILPTAFPNALVRIPEFQDWSSAWESAAGDHVIHFCALVDLFASSPPYLPPF